MIALGAVAIVLAGVLRLSRHQRTMDSERLVEAVRAFALDHSARGTPLPASVSLTELINRGFIRAEDVKPFAPAEVRILLISDESRPNQIVIEARLPDGSHIAGMSDGSIVQLRE
jgi:hypothetical protein